MEFVVNAVPAGGEWFSPDIGDNLSRPSSEQAQILYEPMTVHEVMKVEQSQLTTTPRGMRDIQGVLETRQWAIRRKVLEEKVKGTQNMFRKDAATGEVVPIKDGKELVATVLAMSDASAIGILHQTFDRIVNRSRMDEDSLEQ